MLGLGGLGLITTSNFYVPQVNQPGSMATFVLPAAVPLPVRTNGGKTGSSGLGQTTDLFPQGFPGLFSDGKLIDSSTIVAAYLAAYWPYLAGGALLLILLMSRR